MDPVLEQRRQLEQDAAWAEEERLDCCLAEWTDIRLWQEYTGPKGKALYSSYTDQELLEIIRSLAERLGRTPYQCEIFCVYRHYIRQRFGNWPKAMEAAGLRTPKPHKHRQMDKNRERDAIL